MTFTKWKAICIPVMFLGLVTIGTTGAYAAIGQAEKQTDKTTWSDTDKVVWQKSDMKDYVNLGSDKNGYEVNDSASISMDGATSRKNGIGLNSKVKIDPDASYFVKQKIKITDKNGESCIEDTSKKLIGYQFIDKDTGKLSDEMLKVGENISAKELEKLGEKYNAITVGKDIYGRTVD